MLQLRICTCPKRDYEQELKNREKALTKNILRRSGDVVFTYPLTPDGVGGYTEAVKGQAGLEGQNGLNAHRSRINPSRPKIIFFILVNYYYKNHI